MTNSGLEDIGRNYFKQEYVSELLPLEDIPNFKQFFCKYLLEKQHITEDNLEESFRRWCRQLSSGRAFPDIRRFAVYILWYSCELRQYHIARLLAVSTRTIRRDLRVIEKQMFH
ncbi:DeoR family transcriptional regulator [Nitrosopumilus sp. S4]